MLEGQYPTSITPYKIVIYRCTQHVFHVLLFPTNHRRNGLNLRCANARSGTSSRSEASLISFLSRRIAFFLPSPYISGIKTSKIPRSEYAQSSSRVVRRDSAHSNRSSTPN